MRTLGIVLLILGIIMTAFTGFTLIEKKEVLDVGPLEVNKEERTPIYWSPITGLILAAGGAIILFTTRQKK